MCNFNPFKLAGIYASYRFWNAYVRKIGENQKLIDRCSSFFCVRLLTLQSAIQNFELKSEVEKNGKNQTWTNRFSFFFAYDFQVALHSATQNFKLKFEIKVYWFEGVNAKLLNVHIRVEKTISVLKHYSLQVTVDCLFILSLSWINLTHFFYLSLTDALSVSLFV